MTRHPFATLIRSKETISLDGTKHLYSVIATMVDGKETYRYLKQRCDPHPSSIIHEATGHRNYCVACFDKEIVLTQEQYQKGYIQEQERQDPGTMVLFSGKGLGRKIGKAELTVDSQRILARNNIKEIKRSKSKMCQDLFIIFCETGHVEWWR